MSLTVDSLDVEPGHKPLARKQGNAGRRQASDRVVRVVLTLLMALASIPLILILFQVIREGAGVISWEFLTTREFPPAREGGGYAAGFVGTGIMVTWAAVFAVPTGVLAAVYLVEVGRGWFAGLIRFFTDVMTGIPSVFVGLSVYFLLINGSGGTIRFGAFPGAVALGIIMLPIVVRSSEEILRTVPDALRQGSLAMLAVARAAGETAPLVLTALGNPNIVTSLFNTPISAVPLQIYNGARQPFAPGIERAWGGALCLLVLVLALTVTARWIGGRFNKLGGR